VREISTFNNKPKPLCGKLQPDPAQLVSEGPDFIQGRS
jgi:hypothetical protein